MSLRQLEDLVRAEAARVGWRCVCLQTNHEGVTWRLLHEHRDATAMIVNPGAWTHYSYAIRDALELVRCPVAEVHLSDVTSRQEWRRQSVLGEPVVTFTVAGRVLRVMLRRSHDWPALSGKGRVAALLLATASVVEFSPVEVTRRLGSYFCSRWRPRQ